MARFPHNLFGETLRGRRRRSRLADTRSLGVEHLDRRQMLSANAMASFADTGSSLLREINVVLPRSEWVWTSTVGQTATQITTVLKGATAAAKPTVSLSNGVLTVTGTSGADVVEVRQQGDSIKIVGANTSQSLPKIRGASGPFTVQDGTVSLPASLVKQIKIDGGAGNDDIKVRLYEVAVDKVTNVSINAGAGNDKVAVGVDGTMAKKVFADLGNGTDILELAAGVTLGSQRQAETVRYLSQSVQHSRWETQPPIDFQADLMAGVLRGTLVFQSGTLHRSLQVTRTADGYTINQHESGCFNSTDSQVSVTDADLAGPADTLTTQQKNALDELHRMLSVPQSEYGMWVGQNGPRTADFHDGDGDGIDDRTQLGPGLPACFPVRTTPYDSLRRQQVFLDPSKAHILSVISVNVG